MVWERVWSQIQKEQWCSCNLYAFSCIFLREIPPDIVQKTKQLPREAWNNYRTNNRAPSRGVEVPIASAWPRHSHVAVLLTVYLNAQQIFVYVRSQTSRSLSDESAAHPQLTLLASWKALKWMITVRRRTKDQVLTRDPTPPRKPWRI